MSVGDWSACKAPSLGDLQELADEAFARLPAPFRRLCEGVVIRVD
ncbi:MAG TPA: Zn-dependent protease, partial [Beijerinckiaceae bacterium]|nr:Zn-dependent protease [Beijerinckiaceae bacterium]